MKKLLFPLIFLISCQQTVNQVRTVDSPKPSNPSVSSSPVNNPVSTSLPSPFYGPYFVNFRVEPVNVGSLGDRVKGIVKIIVDAPGATKVEAYLQPLDGLLGKAMGESKLIGSDETPADRFIISWNTNTSPENIQIYIRAYGQPDVNFSRASEPKQFIVVKQL